MTTLFVGAGFSYWAANLPLANDLFDFQIDAFGVREPQKLERVMEIKSNWDKNHPDEHIEAFIHYAINQNKEIENLVKWYLVRRLSEPYLWYEKHANRWRRHVLMIDENRALDRPGVKEAKNFLNYLIRFGLKGIITTNYDLLVEYALGTKNFNYGSKGEVLTGRGPYPVSQWQNPVRLRGKIPISKVHGSISWDTEKHYTDGRRGLTGNALIVAPNPEKNRPDELISMWSLASNILRDTNQIIFFGFGFNRYDSALLDLLSENGNSISKVILIDVDPKTDIAQELWPKAIISSALPPPDGSDKLQSWLEEGI
ncbi:MAG: SIR2 family protein [Anaerolineales bacterium]